MTRLLAVLALSLVVIAGSARAAGPSPGLLQGAAGITTPAQKYRFVTLSGAGTTTLAAIDKATGSVVRWRTLRGEWGIPLVALDGTADGLSRDGKTLVVADWVNGGNSPFRPRSSFRIYDANLLQRRGEFTLRGDFSFDALSPDGRTLYLIQHVGDENDVFRYIVRAYDLRAKRLLPQAIADKRQQGWIMRGLPMKRLTSADGRWVYTLYRQDGGYPFVHALDAANGRAVCIGIPWQGNQDALARAILALAGGKLLISAGGRQFAIDTETFDLTLPTRKAGFPAGLVGGLAAGLACLALVAHNKRRGGWQGPGAPVGAGRRARGRVARARDRVRRSAG